MGGILRECWGILGVEMKKMLAKQKPRRVCGLSNIKDSNGKEKTKHGAWRGHCNRQQGKEARLKNDKCKMTNEKVVVPCETEVCD
ncbi:hypothetical protein OIU85_028851 [Salix viminalis]|uniref:Uncharacterized protein n=1 Tax=Salix viminalis TaxID=40686 RepID=A0A9Q0T6Z1_SALVM|nr:hypothetical protein OIU85_028851 [Salix viminalis]